MFNYSVIGSGFACIDYIKDGNSTMENLGGTCANVLTILSLLGWESYLWLPKFCDKELIERYLLERGINPIFFANTQKPVARMIEKIDVVTKKHQFQIKCLNCDKMLFSTILPNKHQVESIKQCEIETANVFFCDRISEGIRFQAEKVRKTGGLTMYEPNGARIYTTLKESCCQFEIVKFSKDRIPPKWQAVLPDDVRESNVKLIIVSMGAQGLKYLFRNEDENFQEWRFISAVTCEDYADGTGAGDWLTAAFLYYFVPLYLQRNNVMRAKDVDEALNKAIKIATFSCREKGAQNIIYNDNVLNQLRNEYNFPIASVNVDVSKQNASTCPFCGKEL